MAEKFREKGILTSAELCNKLLEDTGVALLPGIDFGCRPDELTARLSYVDFDGYNALKIISTVYHKEILNKKFVTEHCPKVYQGVERIGNWLPELKN